MSAQPKKVLLLFSNSSVRKGLADPEALASLLQQASDELGKDITVYTTFAKSLSFFITDKKVKIRDHRNHMNLEDYDFVYFRKSGSVMQQLLVCALYLKDHGVPFFDTEIARTGSRNKLSQMYMLQRRGVPIPKTLFCRNNRRLLRLISSRYAKHFPYPLIAKATGGTRGAANYLVKNHEEMAELLKNESRHFIIQEFIPNDGDLRFFVAGGGLKGIIGREAEGESHLNNTSQGGKATLLDVKDFDTEVIADALLAARIFQREVAGVDVMFNKETGKHVLLEVNRAPQIEQASFEKQKAEWMVEGIRKAIDTFQPITESEQPNKLLGRFEAVRIITPQKVVKKLIAKVDTGADSSSVHATEIKVKDNELTCVIAGKPMHFEDFSETTVRSSNGAREPRFIVTLGVKIGDSHYPMRVTLTDRSAMNYDMLIGRRFVKAHKLYVDVGRRYIASGTKPKGASK